MEDIMSEKTMSRFKVFALALSLLVLAYHMISIVYLAQTPMQHQIVSLGTMILVLFISLFIDHPSPLKRIMYLVLLGCGVMAIGYIYYHYEDLIDALGFPEVPDMVAGAILVTVVLVGTWICWGSAFTFLVGISILYFFLGHLLPAPFYHSKMNVDLVISYLAIGFSGVFGPLLSVMANFGAILLVFGALLEVAGANDFFIEIGKLAGRRLKGGPGQTAVVGSALVGTVSGAAVGNVMITGAFTIPMMKEAGFPPAEAAAIEATASTGSQLMPPVMGIAAFLMAGFLGINYSVILVAGLIPSFLFFLSVAWGVELIAARAGLVRQKLAFNKSVIVQRGPLFMLPLAVLIVMLLKGFSVGLTGFLVICLVVVLMMLRPDTRPRPLQFFQGIHSGIVMASKITFAVCAVGMVSQAFVTTGLAQKLTSFMAMASLGIPLLSILMTMILAIILGMGLPAAAAYSLVAILVVPGLIHAGIDPLRAHFFVFYFSIISAVTPPVALASMAAATIAGSNYARTGWKALKLSMPNFFLPFMFIFNPVFLLQHDATLGIGLLSVFAAILCFVLTGSVLYNYMFHPLRFFERMLLVPGVIASFWFCVTTNMLMLGLGVAIGFFVVFTQLWLHDREPTPANA